MLTNSTPWHELISCAIRFLEPFCHSFGNGGRVISIGFPESGVAFRRAQQMMKNSRANASSIESRNLNDEPTWKYKKKKIYSANSVYMLFLHFIFIWFFLFFSYIYIFLSFPFFSCFCFCFVFASILAFLYFHLLFTNILLFVVVVVAVCFRHTNTNTNRYIYSTYIDISFHFLL